MLAAIAVPLACTGVVLLRFGTHGLDSFDKGNADQRKAMQAWSLNWFEHNTQDKDLQAKYAEQLNSPFLNSPEVQAGGALAGMALQGLILVLLSTGIGSLAGRLQAAQTRPRRSAAAQLAGADAIITFESVESMSEEAPRTAPQLRLKGRLMSASEIERTLVRLAHEIVEKHAGASQPRPGRHQAPRCPARPAPRRRLM